MAISMIRVYDCPLPGDTLCAQLKTDDGELLASCNVSDSLDVVARVCDNVNLEPGIYSSFVLKVLKTAIEYFSFRKVKEK